MNRLCYAIILLLLLTSPLAAQDDTAPFQVLDEAAIFADGVTVIERLPVLNFDNEARQIYYFDVDSEQWDTYDYPSDLLTIRSIEHRSDGTYLIYMEDSYTFNADVNPEYVWLFEPDLGLTRPPTICNLVQALPDEGEWRFTQLDGEEYFRLCNTETGEVSPALPSQLQSMASSYCGDPDRLNILSSPNDQYVILVHCPPNYSDNDYIVYTYELKNQQFNALGMITAGNTTNLFQGLEYLNEHEFFIVMADINFEIYKADASQPDSLHTVIFMPDSWATRINQSQYLYFNPDDGLLYIADLVTEETHPFLDYPLEEDGRIAANMRHRRLSPDGRYLALYYLGTWYYHLKVLDLESGHLVWGVGYSNDEIYDFIWLSPTTLLTYLTVGLEWQIRRLDIGETIEMEEIARIDYYQYIETNMSLWDASPDNRFVPVFVSDTSYQLYHAETKQIIELFTVPEEYNGFQVEWLDSQTMRVQIGFNEWHIRIDALDEEQS